MVAPGKASALGQKLVEVPPPLRRILARAIALSFRCAQHGFDSPAQPTRRLWDLLPKRLQDGQHVPGLDLVDRCSIELTCELFERIGPLRRMLGIAPAWLHGRNKIVRSSAKRRGRP